MEAPEEMESTPGMDRRMELSTRWAETLCADVDDLDTRHVAMAHFAGQSEMAITTMEAIERLAAEIPTVPESIGEKERARWILYCVRFMAQCVTGIRVYGPPGGAPK